MNLYSLPLLFLMFAFLKLLRPLSKVGEVTMEVTSAMTSMVASAIEERQPLSKRKVHPFQSQARTILRARTL